MKEQRERLDSKKIISEISPENRAFLARLDIFESVDSTNTTLLTQLKNSGNKINQGSWVCLAEEQTHGRGRQGKVWYSPYATNIYCSLSWGFPAPFAGLSALSIACGLMVIQCLNKFGLDQDMNFKWPNDILFAGRKLGGVLLESLVSPTQTRLVIGIGLNLDLPPETNKEWIGLSQALGKPVSRNQVAGQLLDQLFQGISLFERQGLKPFMPLVSQYDGLRGKEVMVQAPKAVVQGLAQGLNEAGEFLLLDGERKLHQFCYGEVSLRLKDD